MVRGAGALLVAVVSLGLSLNACTGSIGGGGKDDGSGDDNCAGCSDDPETAAAKSLLTTRFPRLSHFQWENTIQELLRLPTRSGLSDSFRGDPDGGVFNNNERVLQVTPDLWGDYQTAAEELALMVTEDAAQLALMLPTDLPSDPEERARAYIVAFGERAYRRPLASDEVDGYLALFAKAPGVFENGDDFTNGVRLTIQAFLQSPHFLTRVQSSSELGEDGLIVLSGWELATKLSYLLWNNMPDQPLFDAAAAGDLETPEGVLAQAQRMLKDDRSRATVRSFHAQLYSFEDYRDLYKDEIIFPDFTPKIGDAMTREVEMFIEDVVFSDGGLTELLTAPYTYVNDELAGVYGLPGEFGSEFVRVDLDAEQRSGLLTRLGFLASHATPKEQNTILRGVFVNLRVLCNDVPSPPDNVDGLPPAGEFATNRERVESHTGKGTCAEACHNGLINPPGYALENYNAIGAFVEDENGAPINAFAEFTIDGDPATFDGAIEMSALLAKSDQAHACYAEHWLQFAYGREPQEGDETIIEELMAGSKTGSVTGLMLALTQTKAFRTRAPIEEEVSP